MNTLELLKHNFNIVGLKTSFEDEGAAIKDVYHINIIAKMMGLESTVKIGGCEAKSDLMVCEEIGIDNIVAPMIESPFAVEKFKEAVSFFSDFSNLHINIESISSVNQADDIIRSGKEFLSGVVVGRSDLSKSLGLNKSDTNSSLILEHTKKVFSIAKENGLITTFGGNLNSESLPFIEDLVSDNLIDRVETRLVICSVDDFLLNNFDEFINNSISLECDILEKRLSRILNQSQEMEKRISSIRGRTGFLKDVGVAENSIFAVDFDNVVHNMTNGYGDGTIYGDVIDGSKSALEAISKHYKIIIHTCKANPKRPLVNGKTGVELIREWLIKHELYQYVDDIVYNKPNAVAYIDDKALEFKDWDQCMLELKQRELI